MRSHLSRPRSSDVYKRQTLSKTWHHGANHGALPSEATVELLVDGMSTGNPDYLRTLSASEPDGEGNADGGSCTWTNLDPAKTYSVRELDVPAGYQPSIALIGNGEEGYDFEVDNTFVGSATRIAVQKDWSGTPAPGSLPVTVIGRDASGAEQYRKDLVLEIGRAHV